MIYLNRNVTLNQIKDLVQKNINHKIDYMPEDFNNEQKNALELFQKRIFLEEVIDETISFNKQISWDNKDKNLSLTTTAEELVDVFKLRSDIYTNMNYQKEFPDFIEGLNFDSYDKNSAILFYKSNNQITGSIRIIFDSKQNLPSDDKYCFDYLRKQKKQICELSRLVVKQNNKGLGQEFKNLFKGVYQISEDHNNQIDLSLFCVTKEHYKLYSKFGGISIEKDLEDYGNLINSFFILSWQSSLSSKYFQKVFLKWK